MAVDEALDLVYRLDRPRVLARLVGLLRDFDLAEDALQDALLSAATAWKDSGVPANPPGWLVTVARRKAIDRLRSSAAAERRHRAWGELSLGWDAPDPGQPIPDDRLRLIFVCCHPALELDAQVALTLRSLGGLSTEEIARAFLISDTALAQRIVRAKRKIREARINYRVPSTEEFAGRLSGVLAVVYLIFNAGYLASSGDSLVRVDLCDEALRLATVLTELLPAEPEPFGLAALLHFQDSRRGARADAEGHALTLEEQDRGSWDLEMIEIGMTLLARARDLGATGPYQLKAAIAAMHARTARAELTDWGTIVRLYDRLLEWEPSPVVALNRAVAVAMDGGPEAGLELLGDPALSRPLADYHLFHSTRADLLRRSGRITEASTAYRQARDLTANATEQMFLDRRLAELRSMLDVTGVVLDCES